MLKLTQLLFMMLERPNKNTPTVGNFGMEGHGQGAGIGMVRFHHSLLTSSY